MDWMLAAWVGVAGGATMESVDIIKSIRWYRQMPWNVESDSIGPRQGEVRTGPKGEDLPAAGWKAYLVATVLRLFVSGTVAGVVAATFPGSLNPLALFLLGLGALPAVQQAATKVPLVARNAGLAAIGHVDAEQGSAKNALEGSEPEPGRRRIASPPAHGGPVPDQRAHNDDPVEQPKWLGSGGADRW